MKFNTKLEQRIKRFVSDINDFRDLGIPPQTILRQYRGDCRDLKQFAELEGVPARSCIRYFKYCLRQYGFNRWGLPLGYTYGVQTTR